MFEIRMPYIGGVLSDNEYKFRTKGTKPIVKRWMKELEDKVARQGIEGEKFEIGLRGRFWDNRRPDMGNLHKVIGDSIKKALVDDKEFYWKDEEPEFGITNPELVITIRRLE